MFRGRRIECFTLLLCASGCAIDGPSQLAGEWGLREGNRRIEARQNESGRLVEQSITATEDHIVLVVRTDGTFDLSRMTMIALLSQYKDLRKAGDRLTYPGGYLVVKHAAYTRDSSSLVVDECCASEKKECGRLWFRAVLRKDGRVDYSAGRTDRGSGVSEEAYDKAVLTKFK